MQNPNQPTSQSQYSYVPYTPSAQYVLPDSPSSNGYSQQALINQFQTFTVSANPNFVLPSSRPTPDYSVILTIPPPPPGTGNAANRDPKDDGDGSLTLVDIIVKFYEGPVPWPLNHLPYGVQPVRVYEHQMKYAEWQFRTLMYDQLFVMNTTDTGGGKTDITCLAAQTMCFPMGVIGPKAVQRMWEERCRRYGIMLLFYITYESLSSTRGHQPKHGLLVRKDHLTKTGKKGKSKFEATAKLWDMINRGMLLVFDEYQNVKNEGVRKGAASALNCPIYTPRGDGQGMLSRYAILSATPMDAIEQITGFLKFTGFIRSKKMSNTSRDSKYKVGGQFEYKEHGLGDLIAHCERMDPITTAEIVNAQVINKHNLNEVVENLFCRIIRRAVCRSMPCPFFGTFRVIFCDLGATTQAYKQLVAELAAMTRFDSATGTVVVDQNNMKDVNAQHQKMETAKIPLFAKRTRKGLIEKPHDKFVIAGFFTETLHAQLSMLEDFNPGLINGEVKDVDVRQRLVDEFQAHSTVSNRRLLVINAKAGGVGISLHDTHGNNRRHMLISSSAYAMCTHQTAGRVCRMGQLSEPVVEILCVKGCEEEVRILDALAKKTDKMRKYVDEEGARHVKYPGEYPVVYEDDD